MCDRCAVERLAVKFGRFDIPSLITETVSFDCERLAIANLYG